MKQDSEAIKRIRVLAADAGMTLRGWFSFRKGEPFPGSESGLSPGVLLLFGQAGSSVWECFSRSPEFADGKADPMDRWSRRTGNAIAEKLNGTALYPFEGPPWHPFGQWAQRAEIIRPSPLGILMHPQYGLWHAYRFAITIASLDGSENTSHTSGSHHHACDSCNDRPCLSACPVGAFTNGEYNVQACADYLRNNEQADCHSLGCRARGACPQGSDYTYVLAHRRFHMREFHRALAKSE